MYACIYIYIYIYIYIMCENLLLFSHLSHGRFFCDPKDRSPSGSSIHGISQARILEWVWEYCNHWQIWFIYVFSSPNITLFLLCNSLWLITKFENSAKTRDTCLALLCMLQVIDSLLYTRDLQVSTTVTFAELVTTKFVSYCSWGSQGKNTEVVCHSLFQGY